MIIKFLKSSFLFILLSLSFSEVSNGTVFISGEQSNISILIDSDQSIINSWTFNNNMVRSWLTSDSILIAIVGSGSGNRLLKKIDWNGNLLWECSVSEICQIHHEIEMMPNGNILVECRNDILAEDNIYANVDMVIDKIIELEFLDNNEFNIVWEWHFYDHLIQDSNPEGQNYGIASENPQVFNINAYLNYSDLTHLNCIDYNEILDQIVFSSRSLNEIFIIDHSTTTEEAAGHTGGLYNNGGDFLYRWGNPANYNRGGLDDQALFAPHGVNWINPDYLGGGNLIIFSNEHFDQSSAVIEIVPPLTESGKYTLDEINNYGPTSYEWIYNTNAFSQTNSGAFRLENGNTFITVFEDSLITEVSPEGIIEWIYTGNLNTKRALIFKEGIYNNFIGDLNFDNLINIYDIIILAESILNLDYNDPGDLNQDTILDILDIIILINMILIN